MRRLFFISSTTHIFICIVAIFTQSRTLSNTVSMALLCNGLCKFLGPEFCFVSYVLQLTVSATGGLMNLHILFYRYMSLTRGQDMFRYSLRFSFVYVVLMSLCIISFIPEQDFEAVQAETHREHPDYDLKSYKNFGGFANSHHWCMKTVTWTLVAMSVLLPSIAISWRR
ncbi:unnamed protein product [Caenorhabditis auriculariae]|uniref:Uncharacterized protein n=1 Tax=Caenorhabditis auriculariae TaxID=2777116 RepID=A0A8S1HDH2_9PELO|nr:unnamed protein product [Caenorhabditis auriculariae]